MGAIEDRQFSHEKPARFDSTQRVWVDNLG
jgi:hypothetical protein